MPAPMPSYPILYSFRRCPYAMRARLALAVSGIRCDLREVALSAKPAEMLAISPKGTVPVLLLTDGQVIDESIDIMRHALSLSDPEGWLGRDDPALIALNDAGFKRDLDRYKYPDRLGSDALAHRAAGLEFLHLLEDRLQGPAYLGGHERGMADAAVMPFVRQYAAVDPHWFAAQPLPQVQTWLARQLQSDLFATVMTRAAPWRPGDVPIAFP